MDQKRKKELSIERHRPYETYQKLTFFEIEKTVFEKNDSEDDARKNLIKNYLSFCNYEAKDLIE
ncbi:unnamed protein product [Larinioides sclopetarius]|uniref:Uncharacterized protein n=1 Tax=Larinioides sclopetarius TaxID=280406 RepID=A0AAV1Z482_9ARAC